jgi:hypothetical protein
MHPTSKLALKCYGPFSVIRVISPMVYQLDIPPQWKARRIHDVFHASLLTPYHETSVHAKTSPNHHLILLMGKKNMKWRKSLTHAAVVEGSTWNTFYSGKVSPKHMTHGNLPPISMHQKQSTPSMINIPWQRNAAILSLSSLPFPSHPHLSCLPPMA